MASCLERSVPPTNRSCTVRSQSHLQEGVIVQFPRQTAMPRDARQPRLATRPKRRAGVHLLAFRDQLAFCVSSLIERHAPLRHGQRVPIQEKRYINKMCREKPYAKVSQLVRNYQACDTCQCSVQSRFDRFCAPESATTGHTRIRFFFQNTQRGGKRTTIDPLLMPFKRLLVMQVPSAEAVAIYG